MVQHIDLASKMVSTQETANVNANSVRFQSRLVSGTHRSLAQNLDTIRENSGRKTLRLKSANPGNGKNVRNSMRKLKEN